jgi:hypothetical protein
LPKAWHVPQRQPESGVVRGTQERVAHTAHRGVVAAGLGQVESVPGLPLAEADYTTLALELAVREVDGWRALLTEHLTASRIPIAGPVLPLSCRRSLPILLNAIAGSGRSPTSTTVAGSRGFSKD